MSEETTIRRCYRSEGLRVQERENGKATITGLAVPYNAPSEDLGGFRETFKRGAFKDSMDSDMFADIEHDRSKKLGRTTAGSLRFKSVPEGLRFEIDVPDTTVGRDALEEVRNGTLDAASIAFTDPQEEWKGKEGNLTRNITQATLRAVTLTSFPAYPQTAGTLTQRSLDEWRTQQEETEEPPTEEFQPGTDTLRGRLDLAESEL
jgi:hypothetical protein